MKRFLLSFLIAILFSSILVGGVSIRRKELARQLKKRGCGIGDYHEPNGCLCEADFHCASFVCCHNICADTC
ncbi:uncharacterized protein OCT59_016630 [Rhizophagus irregularis]|uniref:uncharacterized protein n=1 Tax=Rhizophagus irregularis TaxID=588596 RepID=UPI00333379E0|nr:hypothetical protein OCT59_016630 [Rhizophagus irregularis]